MRVCLVLLLIASAFAAQQQPKPSVIEGIVLDFGRNRPLADVPMELGIAGPALARARQAGVTEPPRRTTTDAAGRFSFKDLPEGFYFLNPGTGYSFPGRRRDFGRNALNVSEGQTLNLRLPVVRLSSISGQVLDSDSTPRPAVHLELYELIYTSVGEKYLGDSRGSTTADATGHYQFTDVEPGELYVAVRPAAGIAPFATTFYPGVVDAENAVPIKVAGGTEVGGVDIRLAGGTLHTIRAKVPRPSGVPSNSSAFFTISTETRGRFRTALMVPFSVQSAFRALGDDNYTSPPLPPDTYVVDVTWVVPNSAPTSAALMSSTWRYPRARFNGELGDTDVDAGTITTWSEAVPISGRVFVNGVTPAPRLEDLTFNVTSLEAVGDFVSLKIATDGTFKIPELALGQYVVEPQLPSDLYVTSARFAGRETLDTFFTVEKDSTGPLELTVASGASSITGTVRTAAGDPVTLGTVVLVPALRLRGNPALFRRAVTDSTATFTLRGIPPGDYTLIAWDWVRLYSYYNPEILREVEGRGQKITVASGSRQNVSLRAIEYSSN